MDRKQANLKQLDKTEVLTDKTAEAIGRIQKNLGETEAVGVQTLEELRKQDQQLDDVSNDMDSLDSKQTSSENLQKRFDFWSMNMGSKASKEAAAELALRQREERKNIKEVYQQEAYDSIQRRWKKSGASLVLCTDTNVCCDELFDPSIQSKLAQSQGVESSVGGRWVIDFSLANIDGDGWTYAFDYATLNKTGSGFAKPQWNSLVRRRKWKYEDVLNGVKSVFNAVTTRLEARKEQIQATATATVQAVKELKTGGYVPRTKQSNNHMLASGLTSAGMISSQRDAEDQKLDDETAAKFRHVQQKDAANDKGIEVIGDSLDRVLNIASTMNETVKNQNTKIDKIDEKMAKAGDKQVIINARLKHSIARS